ncbi:DUF4259 domain-containing protein [Actinokineospora xionganensis]|uniref:DUF4259 domain-containing protein n=1 Tax=Actinokineospora xionganensis TaxID=2684470 RepID=A0ABR7L7Z7_9PSEU|nr:DUF4259 domain-containing protein [Actinokineospora xionganensis]MBC6448519.1 DUF4259 domain-containing protein [Actinokineospora xionganensis]
MGAWGTGLFDNDDAADFCNDLDDLAAADRPEAIRAALAEAAGESGYLDLSIGSVAVAAAAIVAAQRPGGSPLDESYGPEDPISHLSEDFAPLAAQALTRVLADDSELRECWGEAESMAEWVDQLEQLRTVLAN